MQNWHENEPTVGAGHTLPAALPPNSDNAVVEGDGQKLNYCAMAEVYRGAAAPYSIPDPASLQNNGRNYVQSGLPSPAEELATVSGPLAADAGQQSQIGEALHRSVSLPQGFEAMRWHERLVLYCPDEGTVNVTQAGQAVGMTLGQINHKVLRKQSYKLKGRSRHAGTYVAYNDAREIMGRAGRHFMDMLEGGMAPDRQVGTDKLQGLTY